LYKARTRVRPRGEAATSIRRTPLRERRNLDTSQREQSAKKNGLLPALSKDSPKGRLSVAGPKKALWREKKKFHIKCPVSKK